MRSDNARGAAFMVIASVAFATGDAFMKSLADDMTIYQAIFVRGIFATIAVGFIGWRRGDLGLDLGLGIATVDRTRVGLRVFGEIGSAICYLTALFHMPMANASAILQSLPLAVTLAAALFFREPVGWRRYIAIGIGFFGVMLILQPGPEGFDTPALWAIASIAFIVLRDLSTRRISSGTSAMTVVFATSLAVTLSAGGLMLVTGWRPLVLSDLGVLVCAGSALLIGYVFSVDAMRTGEIGFVQPFRYTLLLWSLFLGVVVFGERPDWIMLLGTAIVVATGLFTLHREQVTARRMRNASPTDERQERDAA